MNLVAPASCKLAERWRHYEGGILLFTARRNESSILAHMKLARVIVTWSFLLGCVLPHARAAEDIVVADFEGTDYGAWQSTGEAFGKAPARGALPGQMAVDGFAGTGLVNSFVGGDKSTGTLTSPPFELKRKFISFLIGGGGYSNETCMNLRVDGKVLRTAVGPNVQSGGSEKSKSATV